MKLKPAIACLLGGMMALAGSLHAITSGPPSISPASTNATPSSSPAASTADNSNPYAVITDRNVFRLNPVPVKKPEEKKVELPKVNLNGIIRIGDDVRVLFSIPTKDPKTPVAYFKLAPGEKDDVLELVSIHPDEQGVDVLVSGIPETLTIASNSLAPDAAPAPANHGPPHPGPSPAPAAVAASGSSSVVIAGGGGSSREGTGGVTVAGGGGGVTVIGGGSTGNNDQFGGVTVAGGGGGGVGGIQYAGNTSPVTSQTPTPSLSQEQAAANLAQQTANMIIHNALTGGAGPPPPPPVVQAAAQNGVTLSGPPPPP